MEKLKRNSEIVGFYLSGLAVSELSDKYLLHRSTIQKILLENNVTLHKSKSKIKCNRDFFSNYTSESCYWAGFILADGNLRINRNSLQIKLAKIDKSHLYSFLKAIECENLNLVKEYSDYVSLTISLDSFKTDLINNFGVTPKKTYTCDLHQNIPINMLNHFFRGYFDGDGSISKTTVISVSFVGTKMLLNKLTSHFQQNIGILLKSKNDTPPIQLINKEHVVGSISYSGKNAIIIMNYLYNDLPKNCYLKRKLIKYNKLKIDYEIRR